MATKSKTSPRSSTRAKPASSKIAPKSAPKTASKVTKKPASPALDEAVKKVAAAPSRSILRAAASKPDVQEPKKTGAPVSGVTRPEPEPINKKEFVGRVAKRAELRPNQVRAATEAVLEELGRALVNGEELKLPGLGKLQVKRKKDIGKAEIMICKLRRKKDVESGGDPLAPAAE